MLGKTGVRPVQQSRRVIGIAAAFVVLGIAAPLASAQLFAPVTGPQLDGPPAILVASNVAEVNAHGVAAGNAYRYFTQYTSEFAAYRLNLADGSFTLLDQLSGPGTYGKHLSSAIAINDAGTIIGAAGDANGANARAVYWTADTVTPTLFKGSADGASTASAVRDLNNAGQVVGTLLTGSTAVPGYWSSTSANAQPLQLPAAATHGGSASLITETGHIAGIATLYNATNGKTQGNYLLRWDSAGAAPQVLDRFPSGEPGSTTTPTLSLVDINNAGLVAANQQLLSMTGTYANYGYRAVRYEPGSTTPTTLGTLTTRPDGYSDTQALAVNDNAIIVGKSSLYSGSTNLGSRPVKWVPGSTEPVLLPDFGNSPSGESYSEAIDINNANVIVGLLSRPRGVATNGIVPQVFVASVWLADGTLVDLNDFAVVDPTNPNGRWNLESVDSINDRGYVTGGGDYDPDGPLGSTSPYSRGWSGRLEFGGYWVSNSGIWGEGKNWSSGTPAGRFGSARVNRPGEIVDLTLDEDATGGMKIDNGEVHLHLGGHSLAGRIEIVRGTLAVDSGTVEEIFGAINTVVRPGGTNTVGRVTVQDRATISTLEVDIGGTVPGVGYDQIVAANYSSVFKVGIQLVNGFVPEPGSTFDVVTSPDNDTFYTQFFYTAALPPGLHFTRVNTDHALTLLATGTDGDTNLDGFINFADLLSLAKNYGKASGQDWFGGDFNRDDGVDFDDLLMLAKHYTGGTPTSAAFEQDWALAQSLIPEPATALGLLLGASLLRRGRR